MLLYSKPHLRVGCYGAPLSYLKSVIHTGHAGLRSSSPEVELRPPAPVGSAPALGQYQILLSQSLRQEMNGVRTSGAAQILQTNCCNPRLMKIIWDLEASLMQLQRSKAKDEKQVKGKDGAWSEAAVSNQIGCTIRSDCSAIQGGGGGLIQFQKHCQSTTALCLPFVYAAGEHSQTQIIITVKKLSFLSCSLHN